MKYLFLLSSLVLSGEPTAPMQGVQGTYIEARTCDVWTGPCFSNSEINLTGDCALMGWIAERGSFAGQDLTGLKIAAALRSDSTLSTDVEGKVTTLLFVDRKATPAQSKALVGMVKKLGGKYAANVIKIQKADIAFRRLGKTATLEIPNIMKISTAALNNHCDKICGNEEIAYPTLGAAKQVAAYKATEHSFKGKGLGVRWNDPYRRSAFLGTFHTTRAMASSRSGCHRPADALCKIPAKVQE